MTDSGSDTESEGSNRTIRHTSTNNPSPHIPPKASYWSCETCWTKRPDSQDTFCYYCQRDTTTIRRWEKGKKPAEWSPVMEDWIEGEDVYTDWECCDCAEQKLFLGGDTLDVLMFDGWCANCNRCTDTRYKDRREAFCCQQCRLEREPTTTKLDNDGRPVGSFFEAYCDFCDSITPTGKIDITNMVYYCCLVCRDHRDGDDLPDDEDDFTYCRWCDEDTQTIEIDEEPEEDEPEEGQRG
ncbi:hypothetical protein TREMEDRAFT_58499 [Tremella mesenterica DSM 1558]|uniref:uncharacterized protein n=1 Tax=Tremella mesenterica (strain ATCC 24925 / CBS 8224 / DSM 1558 / NBRC 9311 / NRRL Y-6157 / RJB 2259-6 / UBC 559-6) TaxID=578456 RepID=UPI0003F49C32|nr:uncharacterized protein TREMEDRAFT_58499 [Tremella mesenterica DSM 1558]EIW72336.1 hypothetical protein TREMEDRAFT_58499 [Tremella mesenterica DSM 1558]